MKKLICYISMLLVMAASCKKAENLVYTDVSRIQMGDTSTVNATFVYEEPSVTRDTIFIRVNTIGHVAKHARSVKLMQVPEYDYTYVRDPITNVITDTVETEKPFKAQPGVQYVALNDKALEAQMVIPADSAGAWLPVVLLRDASLKDNTYRLRIRIEANEEFSLGEKNAGELTIVFSDRLERFYSWRLDVLPAAASSSFGKYSTIKHQFMIDVLKVRIDEDWYQAIVASQSISTYKNVLKEALIAFNNDPANIASGAAPMRETSDPTSPLVTFPN